jgi:hypothetical protein
MLDRIARNPNAARESPALHSITQLEVGFIGPSGQSSVRRYETVTPHPWHAREIWIWWMLIHGVRPAQSAALLAIRHKLQGCDKVQHSMVDRAVRHNGGWCIRK